MIQRLFITFCVLVFAVVIPILETNASHVFNPNWTPHARFHEVWQLLTNCGLGLLCLWLAWVKNQIRLASVLVTLVMGGILIAHAIQDIYGGSVLSGNTSKTVLGLELSIFVAGLTIILALGAALLESRSEKQY